MPPHDRILIMAHWSVGGTKNRTDALPLIFPRVAVSTLTYGFRRPSLLNCEQQNHPEEMRERREGGMGLEKTAG